MILIDISNDDKYWNVMAWYIEGVLMKRIDQYWRKMTNETVNWWNDSIIEINDGIDDVNQMMTY